MSYSQKQFGRRGELIARRYLEQSGYEIVEMNFATRAGEIDIICRHNDMLIFVEVKTRRSRTAEPESAVDRRKLLHLSLAIAEYCERNKIDESIQLDVISVQVGYDNQSTVRHFRDVLAVDMIDY